MRTNLAYIDQTVSAAVAQPMTKKVLRSIAGFRFEEQVNDDAPRQNYEVSRKKLLAYLDERGIKPLAVLPRAWWDRMVQQAGLIDVNPSEDHYWNLSDVTAPVRASYVRLEKRFALGGLALGLATAASWVAADVHAQGTGNALNLTVFAAVAHVVLGAAGFALGAILAHLNQRRLRLWAIRRYIQETGLAEFLRKRLRSGGYHGNSASFTFPTPPADVAEVLKRAHAHGVTMRVAAEPEAFHFDRPIEKVVADYVEMEIERERERERRMADPIIYVPSGEVVAIIAQFGEFPIEKELVDRVIGQGL